MDLWVKRIGQLAVLAVALFIFLSCEDETSLLGYKNPNTKFKSRFIEIPISSSVMLIDSLITDNGAAVTTSSGSVLVGQYVDNYLGPVTAKSFIQLYPSSTNALASGAVYDSVVLNMRLNFYSYGLKDESVQKFTVHEITGDSLTIYRNFYYSNSTVTYNEASLGEVTYEVDADTLQKYASSNRPDTLVASARLADEFGTRLFDLALNNPGSKFSDFKNFKYEVKGLAMVPTQGDAIIGFNLLSGFSNVTVHYHTMENGAVKDTLARTFLFNYPSFTNINTDRSVSELSGLLAYQSVDLPGTNRYVQSGSGVVTKLDLSNFYAFADTVENIVISDAQWVISDVQSVQGQPPHNSLVLRLLNNNTDQFANYRMPADRDFVSNSGLISTNGFFVANDGHYFYVNDESRSGQNPAVLTFNSKNKSYTSAVTSFAQNLSSNRSVQNPIGYLAIYPNSPSGGLSVNRTIFSKDNIKLRVTYTTPTIKND